jgi:hypothetical protein
MGHLLQIMSAKSQNLMVYQHFPHKCQKLFLNIPFSHPSTVSPHHPIVLVYIYILYMYNSPKVSPMNLTGAPFGHPKQKIGRAPAPPRMLFQIVIAASVQMRQEVCGVGGANGDVEAKQLGAFGLSFFGICGLYVCILLYDVNTCIYGSFTSLTESHVFRI